MTFSVVSGLSTLLVSGLSSSPSLGFWVAAPNHCTFAPGPTATEARLPSSSTCRGNGVGDHTRVGSQSNLLGPSTDKGTYRVGVPLLKQVRVTKDATCTFIKS